MDDILLIERHDGIAVLTMNRPESLNALSIPLVEQLHRAWDELDRDIDTRVVILTGAGRAFCAGTDLKEGLDWREPVGKVQGRYRLQQYVARLTLRLREIPQPVIAAVHGAASGGGFSLSVASDIRIADETARFNAAFVRIGASGGDMGISWLLPRIVGASAASELLYTGRFLDAAEAKAMGLVSRVVPEGEDLEAAMELAGEIMRNSPFGIRMTKELVNMSLDVPGLRRHMEIENRTQILCGLTEDFEESIRAFREKRGPVYTDR
jgi:enoyl-CoA hydratase